MTLADGGRTDRPLGLVIAVAWAIVLLLGPTLLRPWGPATPSPQDPLSFWVRVALVTDFKVYWTAGSLVREGAGPALYNLETQRAFQRRLDQETIPADAEQSFTGYAPFPNPPPMALLFALLTALPMVWAYFLWSALSLLAFVGAVALPLRGRPFAFSLAAIMLTYCGVADTLLWGQVNGFFTLAFSLGLLALVSGRPVLGGVLLGLLWLKPQQAVLFPLVFLLKGRWRELEGMALTVLGIVGLSLAMIGPAGIGRYVELLRAMAGFYSPPNASSAPERMANWRALLMHVFPGIPEATGSQLVLVLGAATLLASLLVWRGPWKPSSPRFGLQMLVLTLATLVASPHTHFHSTVLLLAPLAMTGLRIGESGLSGALAPTISLGERVPTRSLVLSPESWWRVVLWFGYLLALVIWPFRVLSWLLVPYFLLVMGLLIYMSRPLMARGK